MIGTPRHCKMVTTVRLVNTSFMSHNFHVIVMVRTLKHYLKKN